MDNADLLTYRQGTVLRAIYNAIKGGGMEEEAWLRLSTLDIPMATRGHVSERLQSTLDAFDEHLYYEKPRRLRQLAKQLRREFAGVLRTYTQRGLLTLAPEDEVLRYESTLGRDDVDLGTVTGGFAPPGEEINRGPGFMEPLGEEQDDGEENKE
jgi:hypothetical protein